MATKRKSKAPRTRVYLGPSELGMLRFIRSFPDFADKSDSQILKTCLAVVAIDAKVKLDEAKRQHEEAQKSADSSSDTTDTSVSGTVTGGEDNQGNKDSAGEA